MESSDLKFYKEIISRIENFYNSAHELLLLHGFSGCAKSEILNSTLKNLDDNILVFEHLCFEHTTIDDFLLKFYDTFRKFSLEKKVRLTKSMDNGFAQKVSFYFKNTDKKCLIIVDNYELVSKNLEILNFLAHIAKFENTKLVLVSRNEEINFFINQNLKIEIVTIAPNLKNTFKEKLESRGIFLDENALRKFWELTGGLELYLQMTIRYYNLTGIKIENLIEEFNTKNITFPEFIIEKTVSLIPNTYYNILKNLAAINHDVSIDFIKNYNLGDVGQIEYLSRNLLITKCESNVIIKNYFREYFLNDYTVQDKFKIFKNLVEIYEEELTKSPRDRLLRLSRESIRKQIEMVKRNIPPLGKQIRVEQNNFSYISLAQEGATPWIEKTLGDKVIRKRELPTKKPTLPHSNQMSEDDKAILKEYRRRKYETERAKSIENQHIDFNSVLRMANKLEDDFQYSKANEILTKLKTKAEDETSKIEILNHLARNSEKLNNFENAIDYYSQLAMLYLNKKDYENYFRTVFESGMLYKNLYRFESAKEEFLKIVNSRESLNTQIISKAYLGLADIFESENKIDEAIENLKLASDTVPFNNTALKAEINFKTALLYDDSQDFENALSYYQRNIETSLNTTQNKWLSQSYLNSGLIYSYKSDTENAVYYIKKALEEDEKDSNTNGIYYCASELAKLYENSDITAAIEYMSVALNAALELNDPFKCAFARLETGDLYYNLNQNELALRNFFEAKLALGDTISDENSQIINQRIEDMKIRMIKSEFERIEREYE